MMRNHKIVSTVNAMFLFCFCFDFDFLLPPFFAWLCGTKGFFTNFSIVLYLCHLFFFLLFFILPTLESLSTAILSELLKHNICTLFIGRELFVSRIYLLCDGSRTLIRSHWNHDWGHTSLEKRSHHLRTALNCVFSFIFFNLPKPNLHYKAHFIKLNLLYLHCSSIM